MEGHELAFEVVKVYCESVYLDQDVRDLAWVLCINKELTFDAFCAKYDYDWERIRDEGRVNANYFTRDRWLDIDVLKNKLHLSLDDLTSDLGISQRQINDWNLTDEELDGWHKKPSYKPTASHPSFQLRLPIPSKTSSKISIPLERRYP